jgi:CheY-like chemotaxis protein
MPLVTGPEALVKIKNCPRLSGIPFCIFTSSKEYATNDHCYALGADAVLLKPSTFNYDEFILKLKAIYISLGDLKVNI